jgi:NADH-quinone oxidoreductase subunit J
MSPLGVVYFYVCAALALAGALSVVIAKNPIRGAMGLLLLIINVAGLFLALDAQFLAAVQLIVYAGAIVVLFLFVIMLLGPSASTPNDRRGVVVRAASGAVFALGGFGTLAGVWRANAAAHRVMPMPAPDYGFGSIDAFGTVLFSDALIPFEISSALLMVAVVGAVAVARGRQGMKSMSLGELEITHRPPPPGEPAQASHVGTRVETGVEGVFSHEIDGAHAAETPAAAEGTLEERPA